MRLSDNSYEVQNLLQAFEKYGEDWEAAADALSGYDFRLNMKQEVILCGLVLR